MSLLLLAPAGLAALGALLVPLLLHLRRRDERRPVSFAALRWLRQQPRPRFRLRMEEWPLLLLRLLLLALLALWLARPATTAGGTPQRWSVLVPGVDPTPMLPAGEDEQRRWLAPGFPPLEQAPPTADARASTSSLLRQLDAELPPGDTLTVFVSDPFTAADGGLLRLSREVAWRAVRAPAAAGDDAGRPSATPAAPRLVVRDDGQTSGARYLRAAAAAWSPSDDEAARVDAGDAGAWPEQADVRAWLGQGAVPEDLLAWVAQGGTALLGATVELPQADTPRQVPWRAADGQPLLEAQPSGRGHLLRFTRTLSPEAMPALLDAAFAQRLRDLLAPAAAAPMRVDAAAYRPSTGAAAFVPPPRDLRPWWALAIALVFLLERWMASVRRRGGVA